MWKTSETTGLVTGTKQKHGMNLLVELCLQFQVPAIYFSLHIENIFTLNILAGKFEKLRAWNELFLSIKLTLLGKNIEGRRIQRKCKYSIREATTDGWKTTGYYRCYFQTRGFQPCKFTNLLNNSVCFCAVKSLFLYYHSMI